MADAIRAVTSRPAEHVLKRGARKHDLGFVVGPGCMEHFRLPKARTYTPKREFISSGRLDS